ncbi:hypothetical protein ACFX2I_024837 [Malus domestica]
MLINERPGKKFKSTRGLRQEDPLSPYLFFIVSEATKTNCTNIVKLLDLYCHASGQEVSFQKSTVYFSSNTSLLLFMELCDILDMLKVDDPGNYLGISMIWGRCPCIC